MTVTEQDEHRANEYAGDDGRLRCAVDGYLWPCPTVRLRPEALLPGGEVLADEVGVGWAIWSRTNRVVDGSETGRPIGGVVVDVREEDAPGDVAAEPTCRPSDVVRVFHVLDWRGREPIFVDLRTGDFDPLLSSLPNSVSIRNNARRLMETIGKSKGTVTPHELDLAECALRLYRQVA